jgi:hypothetical protein
MDYQFSIAQCDVPQERRPALDAYRTNVPVMAVMMLMGRNRKIMGEFVLGGWLLTVGWLATAVMGACVLGMAATVIAGG